MLSQPICLLKLMLNLFYMIMIKGREPYLDDFIRYTINIGLHLDVHEPICLKLGIMIDSELSSFCLISVLMTFTFIYDKATASAVIHF